MFKTILSVAVACAGVAALSAPAMAAPPAFCAQYAQQAVHEVDVNMSIPGCFKGFDARWDKNFNHHYNWCLGVAFEQANAERDYRRARLAECRAHAGM